MTQTTSGPTGPATALDLELLVSATSTPTIRYVSPDGAVHAITGRVGDSVMETAVRNGVPGIVAECGGACACATCHVYVDAGSCDRAGACEDLEDDMLDGTASERLPSSRLSCQVRIRADFDGFTVRIAPEQV